MPRLSSRYGPKPSEIARRIRAERERLGISQLDAARRLKVQRNSYRQLEVTANPTLGTMIGLVTELGFDPRSIAPELFGGG